MAITEQQLRNWTARSSDNEEAKCERSLRMIRQALTNHAELQRRPYRLIAQGSYHNNTNVRLSSDVDICVVFTDVFDTDFTYARDDTFDSLGLSRSDKVYAHDKAMVEAALRSVFGRNMEVGKKAFAVHSTQTTRVDADVVAAWGFNGYTKSAEGHRGINQGIAFWTQDNRRIVNFPEQHHENGKAKNLRTSRYFKRAVRILKRMRYDMLDKGVASADGVSSFLLECAMYNVPDKYFADTWQQIMYRAMQWMLNELQAGRAESEWVETSGMKWLFQSSYGIPSNWRDTQLTDFLLDAMEWLDG